MSDGWRVAAGPARACDLSVHIHRPDPAPRAEYIWTSGSGHEVFLCGQCCAMWRANVAEDPSLTPSRIRSIPSATVFFGETGADPDDPAAWTVLGSADPVGFDLR